MKLIKWIRWRIKGRPNILYAGFHCGCCGKWVKEKIRVPTYKSDGEWLDTWGICESCAGDKK